MEPAARVLLATGATMVPFYERVAETVPLAGLTMFLLDEFGGLPDGDAGRCVSMIRRHLLDRLDVEPVVHAPDVDAGDLDQACRDYRGLLAHGVDLAIVGLGQNGHIGMNEPGSGADEPTRVVELARSTSEHASEYGASRAPTWGITVGLRELLAARHVWLLVTGAHKREILSRTLAGPIDSDVPATLLRRHPRMIVFADASAATP